MSSVFKVDFKPNPLQEAFIKSHAKADLFSSRVGEGKSAGLCWSIFYHTRHNPGAQWALIRDTWENIHATTLKEFFKWFPPGIMGTWHEGKKTFTWSEGIAKGDVAFLGMDDPKDATKLMSRELAGIAIDEPAPAEGNAGVSELVFDIGFSRLRQAGMSWYAVKLATNNPDETHWTYRRFVDPGTDGFKVWQPQNPENQHNLPAGYYEELRRIWGHRPDLIRRFIEGKFGFQQIGRPVTPEFDDIRHLNFGLGPIRSQPLYLLWDFGLNPTCLVSQVTPMRQWNILDAQVGDGIGVYELTQTWLKPLLATRYRGMRWDHIGDPAGLNREQSDANVSAVKLLRRELGGKWTSGPKYWEQRIEPLRALLTKNVTGSGGGVLQIDRDRAPAVWHALRGGWHYNVARTGIVSAEPVKNIHSHPGDALSYGAAVLFPLSRMQSAPRGSKDAAQPATFFSVPSSGLGFEKPGKRPPANGAVLKGKA